MEIKPFDPWTLVLISLLNPVVIAVAFYMGRLADQPQKLVVAAFASSLPASSSIGLPAPSG